MPRDPKNLVHASALSTAEGKRLQSMMHPVLLSTGRGGSGLSGSPNRSPTNMPESRGRTGSRAAPKDDPNWDAVSEAIMRRARGEMDDTSRVIAEELIETAQEGGQSAANALRHGHGLSISTGPRSPSAVDFSPVLQVICVCDCVCHDVFVSARVGP